MKKTAITLTLMLAGAAAVYADSPGAVKNDSVPAAWSYESKYVNGESSDDQWWEGFDDPLLTALIKRAEENSLDLRITFRRIEMARQNMLAAKAGWSPTVGLSAGWDKSRTSGMTGPAPGTAAVGSAFSLGLNFNWEIDLFGRVSAQVKQNKAAWQASRADYQAAMITLSANVATAYVNLRLAQAEIEIAEKQIESQENIKDITNARYDAGLASKLDVEQALTVLYATQATLPSLHASETNALNTLALLCGCYPDQLDPALHTPKEIPNPFRVVSVGVPSDLVRRRPDIIAAECDLAQYAAALGIAKKDFLPTLELTGSIGTSARRLDKLFSGQSLTYSIAPQLSWTLFEGLARNRRVASAKEEMLNAIDSYNLTVMNSVIEVSDALVAYECSLREIELMRKVSAESHEALKLAVDRYKRGLTPFTDVMNAQVSFLNYTNQRYESRAAAMCDLIKVYTAVAGSPEEAK